MEYYFLSFIHPSIEDIIALLIRPKIFVVQSLISKAARHFLEAHKNCVKIVAFPYVTSDLDLHQIYIVSSLLHGFLFLF